MQKNNIFQHENSNILTPSSGSKISRCMMIEGDIKTCEPIVIDGRVIADIKSDDAVIVSRGAFVVGNIEAKEVRVDGVVKGNINTNIAEITKHGLVEGDINSIDVLIYGTTKGKLTVQEMIAIDEDGTVSTSNIQSKKVIVFGKVKGDIKALELIEIKSNGIVEGDISTKELKVQGGGRIEGKILKSI